MRKRESYLDLIRCTAIMLVIGLHVISSYIVEPSHYGSRSWLLCVGANELFRAGVPLFFMISGYLMLNGPASEDAFCFYRKRLPRIVLPLLTWNVIYTWYYAAEEGRTFSLKELTGHILNNGSAYHMWYVYTLLGVYLLTPFLRRMVRGCSRGELWMLLAIILFTGTLRPAVNTFFPIYLYLFEPLMEGYIGYFLLGYLLGTARLSFWKRAAAYLLGVLGAAVSISAHVRASSLEAVSLPFNFGYSFNHYLCAAAVFIACRQLMMARDGRFLALPSDLVFGVYWIHVLVLETLSRLCAPLALPPAAYGALLLVLTALISFAAAFLVSKTGPLRRLFM